MKTPTSSEHNRSYSSSGQPEEIQAVRTADRWLSAREASHYMGVSVRSLRRYRDDGLVPKKIRGRILYDRLSIDRFLEASDAVQRGGQA